MGVVVALIMSVASRSLSDTVLSRQERESSAAFSVAETGVENALNSLRASTPPSSPFTLPLSDSFGFASGQYTVLPTASYALYVREGDIAQLDLSTFVSPLSISWTRKVDTTENVSSCTGVSGGAPAALEINSFNTTVSVKSYYNPAGCAPAGNGFSSAASDGGSTYRSTLSYTVPAGTTAIRIRPLYSGATISVSGAGLTTQLYLIQSSATGGDAQKEIEVKRGLDAPPSVFDYAIFSGGTIVK